MEILSQVMVSLSCSNNMIKMAFTLISLKIPQERYISLLLISGATTLIKVTVLIIMGLIRGLTSLDLQIGSNGVFNTQNFKISLVSTEALFKKFL